jgi:hypothetical protein
MHLPGGPPSTFFSIDVRCYGSPSAPYSGSAVDVFYVDGGCSCISVSTSQGICRRCFPALIVDAHGFLAPTPSRGPSSTLFSVDSERSRIFSFDTCQGARHRCFLALMVDTFRSPAPTTPRGATIDVFYVDGGRSGSGHHQRKKH